MDFQGNTADTAIKKLLGVARGVTESLERDLADIERARIAGAASLDAIERSIEAEAVAPQRGDEFPRFMDGARERRRSIVANLMSLEDAKEAVRERLEAALIEQKKLEQLVSGQDDADRLARRRRDDRDADDIAAAMARG